MFQQDKLSVGVFFPIEAFQGDNPTMRDQEKLAQRARCWFSALWFRDVPLRDPSFGDIGQVFDPWVYLGWIAAHTTTIALATGAIILPLRHPLHTAKSAASIDQLSVGRLVLALQPAIGPLNFRHLALTRQARRGIPREFCRDTHGARKRVSAI